MRKTLLLSIFALSVAVFTPLSGAQSAEKHYFGFSSGYSFQELDLNGPLTVSGTTFSEAKIKEDGIFIAPRAGISLKENENGRISVEFEPRWTTGAYDVEDQDGNNTGISGTFNHILLPLTAVVKAGSENGASLGVGSGINLYDLSDDAYQVLSVPLIFKLGLDFSTMEKTKVGLNAQLMISLWDSESSVNNLVSAGFGLNFEFD